MSTTGTVSSTMSPVLRTVIVKALVSPTAAGRPAGAVTDLGDVTRGLTLVCGTLLVTSETA